jgi:AraC family transcriptional regulator
MPTPPGAPPPASGPDRLTSVFAIGACELETPSLADNVVALHLGGAAPVSQALGGRTVRRPLNRGQVSIIPAFERTSWAIDGPVEFLHLYLPPGLLAAAADEVGAGGGGPAPTLQAPFGADDPLVEQILHALVRAEDRADPLAGLYVDALVRALTLHLLRHHAGAAPARPQRPPPTLGRPALALVLDFVEANLDRPMALAELAAVAGLSVFHFARVFRRTVGATPHRYVQERRVLRARELLAGSRLPMIEVAAACGFASPSHFATTFRRFTRLAPREYRRQAAAR